MIVKSIVYIQSWGAMYVLDGEIMSPWLRDSGALASVCRHSEVSPATQLLPLRHWV